MDQLGIICDRVPVVGFESLGIRAQDSIVQFGDVRKSLQGYVRGFRPGTYFQRSKLMDAVVAAEIVFDQKVPQAKDFRQQCRMAAATLGLVLCLQLFPWAAVQQMMLHSGHFGGFKDLREQQLAHEVFTSLDLALADNLLWTPASMGSWPFFALLASLAEGLAPAKPPELGAVGRAWETWLDTGKWTFSEEIAPAEEALRARNLSCDAELAAAAITLAAQRMQRLDEKPAAVGAAVLKAAHAVVLQCGAVQSLIEPPWVLVWRGLDRLVAPRDILVTVKPFRDGSRTQLSDSTRKMMARITSAEVTYPMSLHPPHIVGSQTAADEYWFLSDRIRVSAEPHCNHAFMDVMEMLDLHRILRDGSWPLRIVDIGAHLGDCSLWAAARWSQGGGLQALAVEKGGANAAAIRRGAKMAGLPESVLRVLSSEVVSEAPCIPSLEGRITIDCILSQWSPDGIELISVFLGFGLELSASMGALGALKAGKVQGLLLRTTATSLTEIYRLVEEQQLPYRVVTLRSEHDTMLARLDSYLDLALQR